VRHAARVTTPDKKQQHLTMATAACLPFAARAPVAPRPALPAAPARPAAAPARRHRCARLAASAAPAPGPATPTPPPPPPVVRTDFLVLGSGIAGLTFALRAAAHGSVAIATKAAASAGCTSYAQGGVCAALAPGDSPAAHAADTLRAGDFANDAAAVAAVCGEGPEAVLELAALGARFTQEEERGGALAPSSFHLTREGGHSARRVVHAADATGAEVQRALEAAVAADPRITIYEHVTGLDLVLGEAPLLSSPHAPSPSPRRPCLGADALHTPTGTPVRFVAGATILATGGAGAAFPLTTNPAVATGDGLAMAARAGARLADMEFVQFHPTAFCPPPLPPADALSPAAAPPPSQQVFLISEAVRGEGGRLLNDAGERFMARFDPARLELAPRDVVARAIEAERAATGSRCVWLDVSHLPASRVLAHFPTIAARCAASGVDITTAPIPVAPAQHYMCGGVRAGLHAQTDVPGLFAVGEAARTGLHGANRLASNSLLEGLVFARRAADGGSPDGAPAAAARTARYGGRALDDAAAAGPGFSKGSGGGGGGGGAVGQWATARRAEAAAALGTAAGIVRTRAGLTAGAATLARLASDADAVFEGQQALLASSASSSPSSARPPAPPLALVELRNALAVSRAVVAAGLSRRESRGGHFLADAPPPRTGGGGRRKGGCGSGGGGSAAAAAAVPAAPPPATGPAVSTCLSLGDVAAVCAAAAAEVGGEAAQAPATPVPGVLAAAATAATRRPSKKKKAGGPKAPPSASKKAPPGAANNVVSAPPLQGGGEGAPSGAASPAREVAARATKDE